jgi:hypothetical protein
MQACLRRSHVLREHEWIARSPGTRTAKRAPKARPHRSCPRDHGGSRAAPSGNTAGHPRRCARLRTLARAARTRMDRSFARHANGQTSAERTPASLMPGVPWGSRGSTERKQRLILCRGRRGADANGDAGVPSTLARAARTRMDRSFARHANGQTSAERTPASLMPQRPRGQHRQRRTETAGRPTRCARLRTLARAARIAADRSCSPVTRIESPAERRSQPAVMNDRRRAQRRRIAAARLTGPPAAALSAPPPARHCDIFEVSTPELDDVVRLEDRYGRTGTSVP